MSAKTRKRLEKILLKQKGGDARAARKYRKGGKIVSATSTISSLGMAAATPAVAGAAGLGGAAATGTVALASAFPIGTIIVAVPALIGLGFTAGKAAMKKQEQYLTKDQKLLTKLIKRYRKRKSSWRQKKARDLLKSYSKHLDEGREKTWWLHDGNKRKRSQKGWKANKAEMEMKMMADLYGGIPDHPEKSLLQKPKGEITEADQVDQDEADGFYRSKNLPDQHQLEGKGHA